MLNWVHSGAGEVAATTVDKETTQAYERMAGITRYVYENFSTVNAAGEADYAIPGYITFGLVFVLSVIVFKLGFARELPLLKNIIIYTFLFLGCLLLTFFAMFLPMVEGLVVAALILIIYKSRMWREKREQRKTEQAS